MKKPQTWCSKTQICSYASDGRGEAFAHQRLGDLADRDLQAVVFNAQFLLRHTKSPDGRNA